MKSSKFLREIGDDDTILVSSRLNPIVHIWKGREGAMTVKDGKMMYDTESEKVFLMSYSPKDWVRWFFYKNPNGTESDLLKTVSSQTTHLIKSQKEDYEHDVMENFKKLYKKRDTTPPKFYIDENVHYMTCKDAWNKVKELDPKGKLDVFVNGYPLVFAEQKEIYWDGYGRHIKDGVFIYGGASAKMVLCISDEYSFMDGMIIHKKITDFNELKEIYDFREMEENKRKEMWVEIERYFNECLPIWKKEIGRITELEKDGREIMIVNFLGPIAIPKPLGDCSECEHYDTTINQCVLSEADSSECRKIINGMKYFTPKS